MLETIRRIFKRHISPGKQQPLRACRTRLEFEQLEDRLVPAMCFWDGGTNADWDTVTNWVNNQKPGPADDVFIRATGKSAPSIAGNVTIRSLLTGQGNNGYDLTINGSLTITGAGGALSWWECGFTIGGTGKLNIEGKFAITAGSLSTSRVYVYTPDANLHLWNNVSSIGSWLLQIGADSLDGNPGGTLHVSSVSASGNKLTGNVSLGNNTVIVNGPAGTINFHNDHDSATTGGLIGGVNNYIHNYGLVHFRNTDDGAQILTVSVPIVNDNDFAEIRFGRPGTPVYVKMQPANGNTFAGLTQYDGYINIFSDSTIIADVYAEGGMVQTVGSEGVASILGDVSLGEVTLIIGSDSSGYQTLLVQGNFTHIGGRIEFTIKGSTPGTGDFLDIRGDCFIHDVELAVHTAEAVPAAGSSWTLINVEGELLDGYFSDYDFTGMTDTWSDASWTGTVFGIIK